MLKNLLSKQTEQKEGTEMAWANKKAILSHVVHIIFIVA